MKKQIVLCSFLAASALALQLNRAQAQDTTKVPDYPPTIIKATTVFTPPEGGDDPNPPQETNTVIYVKGPHIKTESKSETSHSIVIIDREAKRTTMLTEANGRKSGYYSIDTPRTVKPRLDSNGNPVQRPSTNINYIDSTKVIAGITCKKAVATTAFGGRTTTVDIWYTTDLPLKQPLPTGNRGFGGFNQLNGFPMAYTVTIFNGATLQYQVSKIENNAKLNDSDFDIPKGYDIKPESERPRNNFGGGGFRIGGGPGGGGPPPGGGM
jgi:GLPGLI family protein